MAIMAKASSGSGGNPVSAGVHIALCTRIVDLGTQFSERFGNSQRKVMFTWEVPDDTVVIDGEEKPKFISKEYTLSLNEKARMRADLESWRGKKFTDADMEGFDLVAVLGAPCQLQVLHNERGYANISSIMSIPKGMTVPEPVGEKLYFDLSDDTCLSVMEKLPEWVRDKIKSSPEYLNLSGAQVDTSEDFKEIDDEDGDLPF